VVCFLVCFNLVLFYRHSSTIEMVGMVEKTESYSVCPNLLRLIDYLESNREAQVPSHDAHLWNPSVADDQNLPATTLLWLSICLFV